MGWRETLREGNIFDASILPGVSFRWKVKHERLLNGEIRVVLIRQEYNPIPESIRCKDCGSRSLYRHGYTSKGEQRYKCRDCGLTFVGTDTLKRMRVPMDAIGAAVGMYYEGLSLNSIRRQLDQIYDIYPSDSTVYEWIVRFTKVAIKVAREAGKARTGDLWAADETVLRVAGSKTKEGSDNTIWLWIVVDEQKSKFLLATHMSQTRTIREAQTLFKKAKQSAASSPRQIITDRLAAYVDGIERVFGSRTQHVQSEGMRTGTHNNVMERLNGTVKDRTKVMRGMEGKDTADLIMQGWAVHYNYIRPHESLGGETPARMAKVKVPFRTWEDIVRKGT